LILCGGQGKRLKSISGLKPKAMVGIGGRVFLDILIDHLAELGVRRFILSTGYKADVVEDYYAKNKSGWKAHDAGIDLCANFMFGLPGDTIETMQKNLEFALELKRAFPSFFCTTAIPGSGLYNIAFKNNTPLPDSCLGYASQGYNFLPFSTESLSAAQVLRFRDHGFNAYFINQGYLSMIEKRLVKNPKNTLSA
jgi:hypothetical protein